MSSFENKQWANKNSRLYKNAGVSTSEVFVTPAKPDWLRRRQGMTLLGTAWHLELLVSGYAHSLRTHTSSKNRWRIFLMPVPSIEIIANGKYCGTTILHLELLVSGGVFPAQTDTFLSHAYLLQEPQAHFSNAGPYEEKLCFGAEIRNNILAFSINLQGLRTGLIEILLQLFSKVKRRRHVRSKTPASRAVWLLLWSS